MPDERTNTSDTPHETDTTVEHADTVGDMARGTGRALFGPDLLAPGPRVWPFGQRARQRRAQRHAAQERAEQRRAGLRRAWNDSHRSGPAAGRSGRWAPVSPKRHTAVVASIVAVVVALGALSWWVTSDSEPTTQNTRGRPAAPTEPPSTDTSDDGAEAGQKPQLAPGDPIPPDGVAPIVPDPGDTTRRDPQQVHTVPPPTDGPSAAGLSQPESAAAGWLAQWCPFDYRSSFGAAQSRAQPWMTPHGWETSDPRGNPRAAASWKRTVAAGESAACSRPQARVVPEAPRSANSAIVQITTDRVVTGVDGQYVEPLSQRRIVQRGSDGLWRVDAATRGG